MKLNLTAIIWGMVNEAAHNDDAFSEWEGIYVWKDSLILTIFCLGSNSMGLEHSRGGKRGKGAEVSKEGFFWSWQF